MAAPMIGRLEVVTLEDLRGVASGYVSTEKYQMCVRARGNDGWYCELKPTVLSPPYVKLFRHEEFDLVRLNAAIASGTSIGAWDGGLLVGIAITERMEWNRNLVLWEFHVAEPYRRHGIGREMMERVIRSARALGVRSISAETQNTNMPAIRFYRSCGFTIQGIDLSLYADDQAGEDREVALFMRRFV